MNRSHTQTVPFLVGRPTFRDCAQSTRGEAMMSTQPDSNDTLLQRIAGKRSEIAAYLSTTQPRNRRLANTAVICSAIAAALTTGPAVGGKPLTAWLTGTLGLTSPVWQLLCLAATVCSVAAAIATNMSKSHETVSKILRAQTCDAKLEGLETLIDMDQIDLQKASSLYTQYLPEISFIGCDPAVVG